MIINVSLLYMFFQRYSDSLFMIYVDRKYDDNVHRNSDHTTRVGARACATAVADFCVLAELCKSPSTYRFVSSVDYSYSI
jgi:hypothetical protein